ncbi:MAG: putative sugar nucleotidyl transferase [Phycisphaerales bacterium]|jgi:UDP-N-acetylglucosamine diphosphorylase/glucosamine-1-phosphate N-acetyltransferase|nr:putative sugar nucleotidyl transferase [Phycisphaerales bacterium]
MSDLLIFDDSQGSFGPLTQMRPVMSVRTGAVTTLERIERTLGRFASGFIVPDALAAPLAARVSVCVNEPRGREALCVNGRWWGIGELPELAPGEAVMVGDAVLAARLNAADADAFVATCTLPSGIAAREADDVLYQRPWDMLEHLPEVLATDLACAGLPSPPPDPAVVVGEYPAHINESAAIFPGVVLDTSGGRIVVESGATVRPNASLAGPCWVGRDATIVDGAVIRANTVIGPGCKVGGEVGSSIFQGWSNKAHDGYLGDSIVGQWVNLGAGTTSSNLLNTYGEISVRLAPELQRERTGRNYCGAFIGDHVKTAIGTRMMTGTSIGTGSMIACSSHAPSTLGPLRWVTDAGEKRYRIERFLDTARAMMARRNRELDAADEARLRFLAESSP